MTPAKERQAAWKARLKDKGLKKIAVVVPVGDVPKVRALATRLLEENQNSTSRPQ